METQENKHLCCYKHAIRKGRASYLCPDCGKQLILEMYLLWIIHVDPMDIECPNPKKHEKPCACMAVSKKKNPHFTHHSEYECGNDDVGLLIAEASAK